MMTGSFTKLCLAVLIVGGFWGCTSVKSPSNSPNEEEWISLFNGENLEGWDIKIAGRDLNDNHLNTFRVEDGMLRIAYDEYDNFGTWFGHLYYEQPFSYYRLKFSYRFVGEQTPGGSGLEQPQQWGDVAFTIGQKPGI